MGAVWDWRSLMTTISDRGEGQSIVDRVAGLVPETGAQPSVSRRRRRRVVGLIAVVAAIGAAIAFMGGPGIDIARSHGTGVPSGMHLAFSDDFTGTSLDTAKWATCYPWWPQNGSGCTNLGNPELQWYRPSQVRVSDGTLHLVAVERDTSGTAADGTPKTYPWRSGMVTTHSSFTFTYGYVAVRARLVKGDGLWSALWLLSEAGAPEIDISELYGNDPTKLSVVLHAKSGSRAYRTVSTPDLSDGWHTYALDWEPSSITWFVDGRAVYRYMGEEVPSVPMYFIANLAVGNFFQAHPTASTPPTASLDIRRVDIYQR
jgi:beta-glucanase (GH16 family)